MNVLRGADASNPEEVPLAPDGNDFARGLEGGHQRGNVQRVVDEPRRRVDTHKYSPLVSRMLVAFRATVLVRPKSPEERHVRGLLGAHGLGTEYVPHPGPVVIAHIILLHIPLAQYSGEESFDLEVSCSVGVVISTDVLLRLTPAILPLSSFR